MGTKTVLRIQVPNSEKSRYISFKLKTELINEPASFAEPGKLLFISCFENRFSSFHKKLVSNKVIDRNGHWKFGDGHIVIIGMGEYWEEEAVECLWLVYSLEEKAKRAGGYVHFIIGKHEIENLHGTWRFQHPAYATSRHNDTSVTALYYGNNTIWQWLLTKNIVEKIGNILVVQAGIPPVINNYTSPLTKINNLFRSYHGTINRTIINSELEMLFNMDKNPDNFETYDSSSDYEENIDTTLNRFGVKVVVTANNKHAGITLHYNGKLINVNFPTSTASESLLILGNKIYINTINERKKLILTIE